MGAGTSIYLIGYVLCPSCQRDTYVSHYYDYSDYGRSSHSIGEFIDDTARSGIYANAKTKCGHCGEEVEYFIITKKGYLYGFSNFQQIEKIKKALPLMNENKPDDLLEFKLYIDKDLLSNKKLLIEKFKKAVNQLEKNDYSLTLTNQIEIFNETTENKIKNLICRQNGAIRVDQTRPAVNDIMKYDPRRFLTEEYLYADVDFKIEDRVIEECTQLYKYKIRSLDGKFYFENVLEKQLKSKIRRLGGNNF